MDWRLYSNINSHPSPPPVRPLMPRVRCCDDAKLTLARVRTLTTFIGGSTDSGWTDWEYFTPTYWMAVGFAINAPGNVQTSEHRIEIAAGIGRPWKIVWIDKITTVPGGVVSYSSPQEQIVKPGDSFTVNYSAASNTQLEFYSALLLIPAEGS